MLRGPSICLLVAALPLTACTSDEPTADDTATTAAVPVVSVTEPPSRLTPFCEAMIELTDGVRGGEFDDVDAAILSTYRAVADEAPDLIADDFALVLAALESGAPPPTDPPRDTVPTTPPQATTSTTSTTTTTTTTTTAAPDSSVDISTTSIQLPADTDDGVDEGFAPADSPAERVNNYVDFACRSSANNPGPPATEPIESPADGSGGDVDNS